jgi:diacylglycerol O-acyltransferase / trehalose O-mycolyltransferase
MGGLGAVDYAARRPGMFAAAASFSGIVHTRQSSNESQGYLGLIKSRGEDPLALWGAPDANVDTWKQHNPYDLAAELKRRATVHLSRQRPPRPARPRRREPGLDRNLNRSGEPGIPRRIQQVRLDAQIDLHGPGTHHWVYWQRELHRAWPLISKKLALQ